MKFESFSYKYANVKIFSDNEKFFNEAKKEIIKQIDILEIFIKEFPEFESSLENIEIPEDSPDIAKKMAEASTIFGIGPMSSVAGTVAEFASNIMKKSGAKIAMVENGGDLFISNLEKTINVGIFSGNEKFNNLGLEIGKQNLPIAICSSSGKMGHSKSFGDSDIALAVAKSASIADSAATYLGNLIKNENDINRSLDEVFSKNCILGALSVKNNKIGIIGHLPKIIRHADTKISKKITKSEKFCFY